ncbi:MAG: sigma-E factor regulatory protein RseB domain-containing protein [Elusimicrobiota bacterium]
MASDGRLKGLLRAAGAAALLCTAAGAATKAPEPQELLRRVAAGPTGAYEGRMEVIRWYGKKTRAEEARVYFDPPNRYRWEFLAPDGRPERLVVSDGSKEHVYLPREKRVLEGDAVKSSPKPSGPDEDIELLLRNYRVASLGEGTRAGRKVWGLEISPLAAGKPSQRMWIDQETSAVLESRLFREKGSFTVLSRLSHFTPRPDIDDELFTLSIPTGSVVSEHGLDPDYLSLEELRRAAGGKVTFPRDLPAGFVFESADFFEVGRGTVRQARYTDGLAVVSVFQTARPVRLPKDAILEPAGPMRPGELGLTSSGRFMRFQRGRTFYTLIGDVSQDLLEQLAARLK